jgi:hypothetical protein
LIEAYFATSLEPILRLREEFGVTHLLLERSHFGRRPPGYFRPFGTLINAKREEAQGKKYELPKLIRSAGVFSVGDHVLLDLSKIPPASVTDAARP